jgi:hypothetical protein
MENCEHKEISELHLFSINDEDDNTIIYYCANCKGQMSKRKADELESMGSIIYRPKSNPYYDPNLTDMSLRCFFCRGNKLYCNCNETH